MLEAMSLSAEAERLGWRENRDMEAAGRRFWGDSCTGRTEALRLMKQFGATVEEMERWGWSAERIQSELAPCRAVFATSSFMRRCQQWPRGYAGDFETIEYLAAGVNHSVAGSLGWHFEDLILGSPIAQQHRNKLEQQAMEIVRTVQGNGEARVLSMACGGCLDWLQALPFLQDFAGEIVLNDMDPDALLLAESRLRQTTRRVRVEPGNVLLAMKRLTRRAPFDLVVAGGLFDYLCDKAIVFLLRSIYGDLLGAGGVLLFTNLAEGNPWRALMAYGSNWSVHERTEAQILTLCSQAGIPRSAVVTGREATRLAIMTRVLKAEGQGGLGRQLEG